MKFLFSLLLLASATLVSGHELQVNNSKAIQCGAGEQYCQFNYGSCCYDPSARRCDMQKGCVPSYQKAHRQACTQVQCGAGRQNCVYNDGSCCFNPDEKFCNMEKGCMPKDVNDLTCGALGVKCACSLDCCSGHCGSGECMW